MVMEYFIPEVCVCVCIGIMLVLVRFILSDLLITLLIDCCLIGFGLASHLGVVSSIPCVGVAKKLFHVDGLIRDSEYKEKVYQTHPHPLM